jgi:uncharacterized protein YdiU (UPF0061 family)
VADGLGRLVSEHVLLAKLELASDAKAFGAELGKMAAFASIVLVGYSFLAAAAALGLSRWIGLPWALGAVGCVNLALGAAGLFVTARRLDGRGPLQQTLREMHQSAAILAPTINGKSLEGPHGP